MGLLEAANCGVSQGTELAGSGPNWREAEAAYEEEFGGGQISPQGPQALASSPSGPEALGILLPGTQETPSQGDGLNCPPQIHMLPS